MIIYLGELTIPVHFH